MHNNAMSFRNLLVLLWYTLMISSSLATEWKHCYDTGNFTANSTYARNRNLLLSSLASNITGYKGFYNTTIGQDPDKVYGLALCRGDVSSEDCGSYILTIMSTCPSQKEAYIWAGDTPCLVHYADRSHFGKVEMDVPVNAYWNGVNLTMNLREFDQIWQPLMESTAEKASIGSSMLKRYIYALMQCTPDLSQSDCHFCLRRYLDEYKKCCHGRQAGGVESPNCMLRWDLSPFYKDNIDVPPLLSPPPAPSKFAEAPDETGNVESLQYDFNTIRVATNNFSDANKLGRGGFGVVYKGTLSNGQDIAVKRLSRDSGQGDLEFKNEVLLVAKLQHRNLVSLQGFCLQRNERLLIYEFVPNASLDHFIFDSIKRKHLDWEKRYNIICGIARGILYLHEDSRLHIIHCDLKASNILLDAEMNPKIADFGMARLFQMDQTHGDTSRIVGFSVKLDIFSFGLLILEIVSGQKNTCFQNGESVQDLLGCAWKLWRDGTVLNLVDPTLRSSSRTEMIRCIHIGLLCVQENAADRPTMASLVLMLNSYSVTFPVPSKPAFFMHSSIESDMLSSQDYNSGRRVLVSQKAKSNHCLQTKFQLLSYILDRIEK
ncbi:hypothetical protein ACOSQ4_012427 [Xanthoceras sorbifolium]